MKVGSRWRSTGSPAPDLNREPPAYKAGALPLRQRGMAACPGLRSDRSRSSGHTASRPSVRRPDMSRGGATTARQSGTCVSRTGIEPADHLDESQGAHASRATATCQGLSRSPVAYARWSESSTDPSSSPPLSGCSPTSKRRAFSSEFQRPVVEKMGLEPTTDCLQSSCATSCATSPKSRRPVSNRRIQFGRLALCQLSYVRGCRAWAPPHLDAPAHDAGYRRDLH